MSDWTPKASVKNEHEKENTYLTLVDMFVDVVEPSIIQMVLQNRNWDLDRALEDIMILASPAQSDKLPFNHNKSINGLKPVKTSHTDVEKRTSSGHEFFQDKNSPVNVAKSFSEQLKPFDENKSFNTVKRNMKTPKPQQSVPKPGGQQNRSLSFMEQYKYVKSITVPNDRAVMLIKDGVKLMVILRGPPGSGKSHLARKLLNDAGIDANDHKRHTFSTDNFFVQRNVYIFVPDLLGEAHMWNQRNVAAAVRDQVSPIIVDNTNTQAWEMKAYAEIAVSGGYDLEILEPDTWWLFKERELAKKNVHGVPKAKIRQMLERYEKGVTPEVLLRIFDLRYSLSNTPPQPALKPKWKDKLSSQNNNKPTKKKSDFIPNSNLFHNGENCNLRPIFPTASLPDQPSSLQCPFSQVEKLWNNNDSVAKKNGETSTDWNGASCNSSENKYNFQQLETNISGQSTILGIGSINNPLFQNVQPLLNQTKVIPQNVEQNANNSYQSSQSVGFENKDRDTKCSFDYKSQKLLVALSNCNALKKEKLEEHKDPSVTISDLHQSQVIPQEREQNANQSCQSSQRVSFENKDKNSINSFDYMAETQKLLAALGYPNALKKGNGEKYDPASTFSDLHKVTDPSQFVPFKQSTSCDSNIETPREPNELEQNLWQRQKESAEESKRTANSVGETVIQKEVVEPKNEQMQHCLSNNNEDEGTGEYVLVNGDNTLTYKRMESVPIEPCDVSTDVDMTSRSDSHFVCNEISVDKNHCAATVSDSSKSDDISISCQESEYFQKDALENDYLLDNCSLKRTQFDDSAAIDDYNSDDNHPFGNGNTNGEDSYSKEYDVVECEADSHTIKGIQENKVQSVTISNIGTSCDANRLANSGHDLHIEFNKSAENTDSMCRNDNVDAIKDLRYDAEPMEGKLSNDGAACSKTETQLNKESDFGSDNQNVREESYDEETNLEEGFKTSTRHGVSNYVNSPATQINGEHIEKSNSEGQTNVSEIVEDILKSMTPSCGNPNTLLSNSGIGNISDMEREELNSCDNEVRVNTTSTLCRSDLENEACWVPEYNQSSQLEMSRPKPSHVASEICWASENEQSTPLEITQQNPVHMENEACWASENKQSTPLEKSQPKPARNIRRPRVQQFLVSSSQPKLTDIPFNLKSWDTVSHPIENWNDLESELDALKETPVALPQRIKPIKKNLVDSSTNTNYQDFHLIKNGFSSAEIKILIGTSRSISKDTYEFKPNVSETLLLDKGTMTSHFIDPEKHYDIDQISNLFPHIPKQYILDMVDKCHGDVNWAVDILLDSEHSIYEMSESDQDHEITGGSDRTAKDSPELSNEFSEYEEACFIPVGYEPRAESKTSSMEEQSRIKKMLESSIIIGKSHYSEKILKVLKKKNPEYSSMVERSEPQIENNVESEIKEVDVWEPETTAVETEASSEQEHHHTENYDDTFEVVVNQDLILQLQQKFGNSNFPKIKNMMPVVKLPVSLARQLHGYIMDSIQADIEQQQDNNMDLMISQDEELARLMQYHDEHLRPQLQEIMDMELALEVHRADQEEMKEKNKCTVAAKLSKNILLEKFPHVDPKMLMEVFHAHNYSLHDTEASLELALGVEGVAVKPAASSHQTKDSNDGFAEETDLSDEAHTYREQAASFYSLRVECLRKAQEAFRSNNKQVASYYSQLAEMHKEKMAYYNSQAAACLMSSHKKGDNSLDLHFLHVTEAQVVLDMFLDETITNINDKKKTHQTVFLITGRGLRSAGGISRIKPMVLRTLNSRGILFNEVNPGMLSAFVRSTSPLSHCL